MGEVSFFRRVAPALVLAAAGGVLLYLLPSSADSDTSAAEDMGTESGEAFPSGSATAGAADASAAAPAGTASSAPAASPGATAAGGSKAGSKRVITGDAIQFRFGTVQVKVLLDGTRIANIGVLTAPGGGYASYTNRAVPGMKSKILAAQSTKVSTVSGATYTSRAYAQSVQSALDKA